MNSKHTNSNLTFFFKQTTLKKKKEFYTKDINFPHDI